MKRIYIKNLLILILAFFCILEFAYCKDETLEEFNKNPTLDLFYKISNPSLEDFNKLNPEMQKDFFKNDENIAKYPEFAKEYLYKISEYTDENTEIAEVYFNTVKNIDVKNQNIFTNYLTKGLNINFLGFAGKLLDGIVFNANKLFSSIKGQSIDLNGLSKATDYAFKIDNSEFLIIPLNHKKSDSKTETISFTGDISFDDNNMLMNKGTINGINVEHAILKFYKDGLIDMKSGSLDGYEFTNADTIRIAKTNDGTHKIYAVAECIDGNCFEKPVFFTFMVDQKWIVLGTSDEEERKIVKLNPNSDLAFSGRINMDYDVLSDNKLIAKAGNKLIINGNLIDAVKRNENIIISATYANIDDFDWINNDKYNLLFFLNEYEESQKNSPSFTISGNDFSYTFLGLEANDLKQEKPFFPSINLKIDSKNKKSFAVGDKGDAVLALQKYLGYNKIDGLYDNAFKAFIEEWQKTNGLVADGFFGEQSYKKMKNDYDKMYPDTKINVLNTDSEISFAPLNKKTYVRGESSNSIKELQKCFGLDQTGIYDDLLITKITEWQKTKGITKPNGLLDQKLFNTLVNDINSQKYKEEQERTITVSNINDGKTLYHAMQVLNSNVNSFSSYKDTIISIGNHRMLTDNGYIKLDNMQYFSSLAQVQLKSVDEDKNTINSLYVKKDNAYIFTYSENSVAKLNIIPLYNLEQYTYKTGKGKLITIDPLKSHNTKEVADLFNELYKHIGKPYLNGASGPNRFDCSGLVCWAFSKSNVKNIEKTSAQDLAKQSKKISKNELRAGDLIFFKGTYATQRTITHVAIYAGDGKMLHASGKEVNIAEFESNSYWQKHVHSYGRIIE